MSLKTNTIVVPTSCRKRPTQRNVRVRASDAFTLIELVAVVAIIALLFSIMLPSLSQARKVAQSTTCLSNLRQFVLAASSYTHNYRGRYPIAHYTTQAELGMVTTAYDWDVVATQKWSLSSSNSWSAQKTVRPGLLWQGTKTLEEIHQCPALPLGTSDNYGNVSAYTGYNYNTSYIGRGQQGPSLQDMLPPARITSVRRPSECAMFGDGECESGTNKFMRSPYKDLDNGGDNFDGRSGGTQGYRHQGKTNVGFCDGHAQTWLDRYDNTYENEKDKIPPHTGFLSPDNNLYDLK